MHPGDTHCHQDPQDPSLGPCPPCLTLWMQGVIWNLGCESILALTPLSSQAQGGGHVFPVAQGHNTESWLCTQSPGELLPASCYHIPVPGSFAPSLGTPGYGVTHGTTHGWRSLVPVLQEEKLRDTVTKLPGRALGLGFDSTLNHGSLVPWGRGDILISRAF